MSPVGVLDALQHGERRQIAFLCNYVNLSQAVWLRISRALMPSALAELLYPEVAGQVSTVRVVPDGPVSRLPLAGLTLPDGRQLIDIADVTLLPSLSMLQLTTTDNPADRPPRSVSLHLDESLARVEEEVAAWSNATPATRIARTATRADFLASLRGDPPPDAVVVSAHGDGDPIEWGAALHLADASDVSAGVALGLPWPGIVLLGSCWLGEVQTVKGSEPLGFPIACMLRGARLVVGGFAPIRQGEASQVLAQVARTIGTRPPGPGLAWDAVRDLLARRPELRAEPPSAWAVLTQWSLIVAQQERPLATAPVQIGAEDAPDVEAEDVELALDLASCLSDIGEIPGISDALLRLLEAVGAGGSPITTRLLLRELLEREAEWERFALAIEYAHLADSSVNVEARGPWFLLRLPSGPAAPFTAPACLSLPTALGAARLLRDEFVMPRHLLHAIATDPMSDAHATVTRILGSGGQRVEALLADQVFWEDVPTNQSARHAGFRALARAGYAPTSYPAPPGVPDLPDLLQDARPGPWQPAAALALAGLLLGLSLNTLGTAQAFVHGRGYLGAALSDVRFSGGGIAPVVTQVLPEGPASSAGIRRGDIILDVDQQHAVNTAQVVLNVRSHDPGDHIDLRLIRDGTAFNVTVTIGRRTGS